MVCVGLCGLEWVGMDGKRGRDVKDCVFGSLE